MELKSMTRNELKLKCKSLNIDKCSSKTKNNYQVYEQHNNNIIYEKPVIKWVGGKSQIIDKVIENFPNEINNYHELFLGGSVLVISIITKF